MEQYFTILLVINFLFLVTIFIILLKIARKNNISDINMNLLEKNQAENNLNIQKSLNNINSELLLKVNFINKEFSSMITLIKENIEKKVGNEFERTNKIFKDNIENLNKISENFKESEKKITVSIDQSLENINKKVEERLEKGFKKTDETFKGVIERLSKIDNAQKNIEDLSGEIISLQDILSDKKSRGTFGEVQLSMILQSSFGTSNKDLYGIQVKNSKGNIVDAMLYFPEKSVPVDSKFPLENFKIMLDKKVEKIKRKKHEKLFKSDVKKHINDIASKYVDDIENVEFAIMFVPSESVFAEISAYHDSLIEYAGRKKVMIASPTTFLSLVKMLSLVDKEEKRKKYTKIIHEELNKLAEEFSRYKERWYRLQKDISKVSKDVKDINITSEKISDKFQKVSDVKIEKIEEKT